jgi:hypothetical protein
MLRSMHLFGRAANYPHCRHCSGLPVMSTADVDMHWYWRRFAMRNGYSPRPRPSVMEIQGVHTATLYVPKLAGAPKYGVALDPADWRGVRRTPSTEFQCQSSKVALDVIANPVMDDFIDGRGV